MGLSTGLNSLESRSLKLIRPSVSAGRIAINNGLGYVPDGGLGLLPVIATVAVDSVKSGILGKIKNVVGKAITGLFSKKKPSAQTLQQNYDYGYGTAIDGGPSSVYKARKKGDAGRGAAFMKGWNAGNADRVALSAAIANAVNSGSDVEAIATAAANALTGTPASYVDYVATKIQKGIEGYADKIANYTAQKEQAAITAANVLKAEQDAAIQSRLDAEARARAEATAAQNKLLADAKAETERLLQEELNRRLPGVPTAGPGALPPPTYRPDVNVDIPTAKTGTQLNQTDVTGRTPLDLRDAPISRPGKKPGKTGGLIPAGFASYLPYAIGGLSLIILLGLVRRPAATVQNPRRRRK